MPENRRNILVFLRLQSSVDDLCGGNLWKSLIAECFGTFMLVFIGLGACYGNSGLVGASLAFGFAGALGIWATAPISGGNINPAVSLGLLIARKMSLFRCLFYMLFQFLGSLAAAKIILILTSETFDKVHGISTRHVSVENAFICEIIISFILVFTVMRLCVEKSRSETERGLAALGIGFSITVGILCGAGISGGSMNPARTLGPAVANAHYKDIWIFILGPFAGAILAALLQQTLFSSELSKEHLMNYLANPAYGNEKQYKKHEDDLESNFSLEKKSLKKSPKMGLGLSPQMSPKKKSTTSLEKLELLEETIDLHDNSDSKA